MHKIDTNYLRKILAFTEVRSLEEVVGKMEVMLDFFENNKKLNHLIPLLKTYQFVTKEVSQRSLQKENTYKHKDTIEKLDIEFAKLYFSALSDFLLEDKATKPWKTYFEYCKYGRDIPFLQVILGINAHINGDLCVALYNSNFENIHDFELVNELLRKVLPKLIKYLALEEKDYFGFAGLLMKDLFEREFELLIVKWRDDAFRNYKKFVKSQGKNKDVVTMQDKTESTAEYIIDLLDEIFSLHNPFHVLDKLNKLEVKL